MSKRPNTIHAKGLETSTLQRLQPYHPDKLLLEKILLAGMVRLVEVERGIADTMARDITILLLMITKLNISKLYYI